MKVASYEVLIGNMVSTGGTSAAICSNGRAVEEALLGIPAERHKEANKRIVTDQKVAR